jgi:hypothetical protein
LRRRTLADRVREDLKELVVRDAQIDQPEAAVVPVQAQDFRETEPAAVEFERASHILDADRDVTDAGQALHGFENTSSPAPSGSGSGRSHGVSIMT